MDQNQWIGVGRLLRDPELVPAGRKGSAHINFTIVVNRVVARDSGPKADYMPCTYWGADAPQMAEQMRKGNEVSVVGRIYTDMVLGKSSSTRQFFWEIRVDEIQLGRECLKNLGAQIVASAETVAVDRLHREFEA